jgi:hypothetical protein
MSEVSRTLRRILRRHLGGRERRWQKDLAGTQHTIAEEVRRMFPELRNLSDEGIVPMDVIRRYETPRG